MNVLGIEDMNLMLKAYYKLSNSIVERRLAEDIQRSRQIIA